MKKSSLFITVAMLLGLSAPQAWGQVGRTGSIPSGGSNSNGRIYYQITDYSFDNPTVAIIRPSGGWNTREMPTGVVTIPSSITISVHNCTVTSIDVNAFEYCTGLTSVTIPNSVTSIGNNAFKGCTGLTSVTIPSSVTSIGDYAFRECSGLTSITIPNSVRSIGNAAFYLCTGLTSVTIPNSVRSFGGNAFNRCTGLTSITVASDNWYYDSRNNCNAIIDRATNTLISGCMNTIIPNSVTSIGSGAFEYCTGLTSITIPNSVISIDAAAFQNCSGLTTVTIPNSVTSIGTYAFGHCTGLTSVTIPNSVTSIGNNAFFNCSSLTSVTIPNSVTTISNCAFALCSGLTTVTIPNSVITIGDNAFQTCSGLTTVTIPNSVTSIGTYAFGYCTGLTSVTIPNSVTSIGARAFYNCSGLTSVTIGRSVTSIGPLAFYGCTSLTVIRSQASTPPTLVDNNNSGSYRFPFFRVPNAASIYVPCGRAAAYSSSWRDWADTVYFTNFIESPGGFLTARSNNSTQGSAQVVSQPTCTNSSATVSATANSGYVFDHWSDGSTNNPYTLTVTSDSTLTAYFAAAATVTVLSDNTTMGTVTGGGSYAVGRTATLTAIPNQGHYFVQWQDSITQNPRTVTVTGDTTFRAFFAIHSYTVNVVSANDTMGSVRGSGTYNYGTTVTIAATANSGYRFARWHDGITNATRSVVVTDSATYTAYFELDQYTITAVSGNSTMGSVSGGGNYAPGSNATLTATANDGYHFRYWQDRDTTNPRTVTVVGDATYTAFFAPNSYTVTAVPNDAARGSIRGGGTYDYGATATLTANANSGYHFDHWSDSTTANPYALTVTGDVNLIAYFVSDGGSNSILDIEASDISVYTAEGRICVTLDGQTTNEFSVYDVMGRRAAHVIASDKSPVLPAGVYIIKMGTLPARKVVVVR
ncbi:MAG: leucine-rich repeat protein [Bacteroidales bacterium]|nr:leucine-rich repeat protein [Bacteroidales bacterium]